MDFLSKDQVSGEVLDHLGIIAVTIEKLGLIEKIDSKLPVSANKGSKTRACLQFTPTAYVPRLVRGIQEIVRLKVY